MSGEDDPEFQARDEARRRRIGRLAVILLFLLIAVYLVPLFLHVVGVRF